MFTAKPIQIDSDDEIVAVFYQSQNIKLQNVESWSLPIIYKNKNFTSYKPLPSIF